MAAKKVPTGLASGKPKKPSKPPKAPKPGKSFAAGGKKPKNSAF